MKYNSDAYLAPLCYGDKAYSPVTIYHNNYIEGQERIIKYDDWSRWNYVPSCVIKGPSIFAIGGLEEIVVNSVINNTFQKAPELSLRQKFKIITYMGRVSTDDPSKVAFFENKKKMEEGRWTKTKPGRFLRRLFTSEELTDDIVEQLSNRWVSENGNLELKILTKGSDIAEAYIHGPRSCMSGDENNFASKPYHPSEAYGTDDEETIEVDTALAVLYDGDKIIARTVILKNEKVYSCAYGDIWKMYSKLEAEGYVRNDDLFHEKRMRALTSDSGSYVCPYLDFSGSVSVKGDHLIIGGGEYEANHTNGIVDPPVYCDYCDDPIIQMEEYYHNGYVICQCCFEERYAYCPITGEIEDLDEMVEIFGKVEYKGYRVYDPVSSIGIEKLEAEGKIFYCNYEEAWHSSSEYEYVYFDGETFEKSNFFNYIGFWCEYDQQFVSFDDHKPIEIKEGITVSDEHDIDDPDFIIWMEKNGYASSRVDAEEQVSMEL